MTHKKANAFHLTKNATILTLGIFMMFGSSCKKSDTTDTYTGDWISSADFDGPGRTEAVSFVVGDHAYITSGYEKDDIRLTDTWSYDQNSSTWSLMASMPGVPRNSAVAFTIGTVAYVGTGYDGTNYLNDFYSYNTATNTWDTIANFTGTPRMGAVGFGLANGKGYVGTGYDDDWQKDFWVYDPATNQWAQSASYNGKKRTDAVAFVINNRAYLVSGTNNGTYNPDMWQFNPDNGTWAQERQIINVSDDSYDDLYTDIERSNATVFVMSGIAYMSTGTNNGVLASTWAYDPTQDLWTEKTGLEAAPREGAISFSLNNRGYLGLGNNSSVRFDEMWEFAPNNTQVDNN
jgi:N-acetylneuraminic acid mutarotase